jgi:uncharacterized protein YkwD
MFRSPHIHRSRIFATGLSALAIAGATLGTGTAAAAPCAHAGTEPDDLSHAQVARATHCLLNVERSAHGLSPLRLSSPLSRAAAGHSADMVGRGYFEHSASTGPSFIQRIRHSGYLRSAHRWRLGENLAWGTPGKNSARTIVRAWMHSPRHRKAILTASYHDVGIGIAAGLPSPGVSDGTTYTADFGVRR